MAHQEPKVSKEEEEAIRDAWKAELLAALEELVEDGIVEFIPETGVLKLVNHEEN